MKRQSRRFVPAVDVLPLRIAPTTFYPPTNGDGGLSPTSTQTTTTTDPTQTPPPTSC